jgi:hypothetical protein
MASKRMSKPLATYRSHQPVVSRHEVLRRPWHEPDWQRLWLATHVKERSWRSLALVPGGTGMPSRFIERTAISLSRTGMTHLGQSIHVADATRVQLADLTDFLAEVRDCTSNGIDRVVIALAPLSENVTSVSIAQQSDCALLCILRGYTPMRETRRTIREIGSKSFIGSVVFDGLA